MRSNASGEEKMQRLEELRIEVDVSLTDEWKEKRDRVLGYFNSAEAQMRRMQTAGLSNW
jgi:hypothetical protein